MGQEVVDAVTRGLEGPEHPPLERKAAGNGRRRLDRRGEARLEELKRWRAQRARELGLDPGVFCPNASLEEVAGEMPRTTEELARLPNLKSWWAQHFGAELLAVLHDAEARVPSEEPRPHGHHPAPPQPGQTPASEARVGPDGLPLHAASARAAAAWLSRGGRRHWGFHRP
jgi:ribonuclease D